MDLVFSLGFWLSHAFIAEPANVDDDDLRPSPLLFHWFMHAQWEGLTLSSLSYGFLLQIGTKANVR